MASTPKKPKDSEYYYSFDRDENGKRIRIRLGKTWEHSKELLKEYEKNKLNHRFGLPESIGKLTYAETVERFLDARLGEDIRPNTMIRDKATLTVFAKWSKIVYLSEFNPQLLERFATWMKVEKKYLPETRDRMITSLKSFGKRIADWYQMPNPTKGLKYVKMPPEDNIEFFKQEQVQSILKDMSKPELSVVRMATLVSLNTGARRSEVCFLQWKDIDFMTRRIRLANKYEFDHQTKSGVSRTIDMSANLYKELMQWYKIAEHKKPDDFVLIVNGHHLNENCLTQEFIRIRKRCGIKFGSFHTLRKTFATMAVHNGILPRELMRILGHHDLEIILKYYGVIEEHLRGVMLQFDINKVPETPGFKVVGDDKDDDMAAAE